MPIAKQDTSRNPRTYVFNTTSIVKMAAANVVVSTANTSVLDSFPLSVGVKVLKVGVSWTAASDATPSFNIVYNTNQALGSARAYTQGNIVPNDNSYTGGTPAGTLLSGGQVANPALTTAFPNFQQIGGLGVPTNVAVDGQPVFTADVLLNTTNFPGAGTTTGGQGILIPPTFDAVYPAGVYAYGVAQGMTNAANLASCFTLRATTGGAVTITNLTVTLFLEPILLAETGPAAGILNTPGVLF